VRKQSDASLTSHAEPARFLPLDRISQRGTSTAVMSRRQQVICSSSQHLVSVTQPDGAASSELAQSWHLHGANAARAHLSHETGLPVLWVLLAIERRVPRCQHSPLALQA